MTIDFSVSTRFEGTWAILDVVGEVDVFTAPKLREQIVQLSDQGHNQVVANLEGVTFLESTGLGVLVGGLKRLKEHDGTLALVCTNRPVLRVLSITGLDSVFPVHGSVAQATTSG